MSEEDTINTEFKELEYKYFADDIRLTNFIKLMDDLKQKYEFKGYRQASSFDIYYVKQGTLDEFQRFRNDGNTPELTKKRKIKNSNNWERIESDLPLDAKRVTDEKVAMHVGMDGYVENFKIFKVCFIYWFQDVNYVWYSVYDENMKEKGQFLEVELNKNRISSFEEPMKILKEHETNLEFLGISSQNRLKRSLFEMFRR